MAKKKKRRKRRVILGVGSNIQPKKNIRKAQKILEEEQKLIGSSPFEKTAPVGTLDQPHFHNGAFEIKTRLKKKKLKKYLRTIEERLGRVRTADKNGPRTIDLDIVVYDDTIVDEDYTRYDFVRRGVDYLLTARKKKK